MQCGGRREHSQVTQRQRHPSSLDEQSVFRQLLFYRCVTYRQPLLGKELFVFVTSDNGLYLHTESSSGFVNKAIPYYSSLVQSSKRSLSPFLDTS